METNRRIRQADVAGLTVIRYPDPRLKEVCAAVDDAADPSVRELVEKMFQLMFESRGVGLAAPQVGIPVRLFIASPTFDHDDRRVYVNPRILSAEGNQLGDEGCLSFPNVACKIKRHNVVTVEATDLSGRRFEETGEELAARIFEHETDHLDGVLLVDRMGSVARLANRRVLKELEEQFA
jgi:peptide deformylase